MEKPKFISDKQFTLLLALAVGFFAAVAAFVLHWLINEIQLLLTAGFDYTSFNWLYLVYPVIGIYLTSLFVRYIVKDDISHGITRILYAISSKRSRLKGHNTWSSVIASAITIGFGGSVGAEAPIVLTGSAIGSNLGQAFHLDNKKLLLLVGCGAAAAIAGIFKAPIAGLVFTLEVLMIDLTMASLLPILIASVTATCFTYLFIGGQSLFHFTLDGEWVIERVPATILLGIFCGLVSLYFIRLMTACEGVFAKLGQALKHHPDGEGMPVGEITYPVTITLQVEVWGSLWRPTVRDQLGLGQPTLAHDAIASRHVGLAQVSLCRHIVDIHEAEYIPVLAVDVAVADDTTVESRCGVVDRVVEQGSDGELAVRDGIGGEFI